MQQGSARPLAVKYISVQGRRHSDQGCASRLRVRLLPGRIAPGGVEGDPEDSRQRLGLAQMTGFLASSILSNSAWSGRAKPIGPSRK